MPTARPTPRSAPFLPLALGALVALGATLGAKPAVGADLAARGPATLHVQLLSSDPADGDTLDARPERIRLVFSEGVDPEVSEVALVQADGGTETLTIRPGTDDGSVLVAALPPLGAGRHRIAWRTLSSDGHPVEGQVAFVVRAPTDGDPDAEEETGGRVEGGREDPAPHGEPFRDDGSLAALLLPWLRGTAVGALLFATGALALGAREAAAEGAPRSEGARTRSGAAAPVLMGALALLLPATAFAWALASGGEPWVALRRTLPGNLEAARAALGMLAAATFFLRRGALSLALLGAAVVVTAFTGHALTTATAATAPLRLVHLGAVALWAGGLLVLVTSDPDRLPARAHRVSGVALAAVGLIALTGVALAWILLPAPSDLWASDYGLLVLAKAAGLLLLVGFGYVHRSRMLPDVEHDGGRALRRSVRREVAVMVVVLLLAGWLARTPPPM